MLKSNFESRMWNTYRSAIKDTDIEGIFTQARTVLRMGIGEAMREAVRTWSIEVLEQAGELTKPVEAPDLDTSKMLRDSYDTLVKDGVIDPDDKSFADFQNEMTN